MSAKRKKYIITILLAVSCLLTGWLLLSYSSSETQSIHSLNEVDSLLQKHFRQFNINDSLITQVHHQVDSSFLRKEYLVDVPPSFSKTQFHAVLNRSLYPYDVKTPARQDLSNQSMNIYLHYRNTIIRSVHLQMDPALLKHNQPASILVIFSEPPSSAMLERLISYGEPVIMVLTVNTALRAHELKAQYESQYDHMAFWFVQRNKSSLLDSSVRRSDLKPIKRFGELAPESQVLSHLSPRAKSDDTKSILSNSSLRFIPTKNAMQFKQSQRHESLEQMMNRFEQKAENGGHPILMLHHRGNLLQRLHKYILKFKKKGLELVPPPSNTY